MAAQKLKISGGIHNGIVKTIMSRNSRDICHCEPFSQELIAELKLNSFGCTSLKVVQRSQGQNVEGILVELPALFLADLPWTSSICHAPVSSFGTWPSS